MKRGDLVKLCCSKDYEGSVHVVNTPNGVKKVGTFTHKQVGTVLEPGKRGSSWIKIFSSGMIGWVYYPNFEVIS
jgi:hypothetical protein